MSETPPEFLNETLFAEVLEYALAAPEQHKITNISYKLASSAGDNYLGQIFRVHIEYGPGSSNGDDLTTTTESAAGALSVIAKIISNSEANTFLRHMNVFLKEKVFYRDVLPRLEVLYPGGLKFGPKLYHALKEPQGTLLFEDLNAAGYVLASRSAGLDEPHCELVLRKLAKFHATSMVLAKQDPTLLTAFRHGVLSPPMLNPTLLPLRFYSASLAVCQALVATWPGYEGIAVKLGKFLQNFTANALAAVRVRPQDANVLCHGDIWTNNVLFEYGNGSDAPPTDLTFIDYQMTVWGSLGMDLNYFLSTSVQVPLLQTRIEHLLRVYQATLRETLEALRFDGNVPSLAQVQREVQERQVFGLFAAFTILPIISVDVTDTPNNTVDNLNDDEFALLSIQRTFALPRVQSVLKERLKQFDATGALDHFI